MRIPYAKVENLPDGTQRVVLGTCSKKWKEQNTEQIEEILATSGEIIDVTTARILFNNLQPNQCQEY